MTEDTETRRAGLLTWWLLRLPFFKSSSDRHRHRALAAADAANDVLPPQPFPFKVLPGDARGRQLLERGVDLNPWTLSMWRLLLAEGPWTHILDVGANYGEMLINVRLPPGSSVTAFEPNPAVRACLERNLAAAGRVVAVSGAAVSDRVGQAPLVIDQAWSGKTRLDGAGGPADPGMIRIVVPTTTLAAEVGAAPWTRLLVKIDVEGHEASVLRGILPSMEKLADFAALVEILHLGPEDRAWLMRDFAIELFDYQTGTLEPVTANTHQELAALLTDRPFYKQEVVVRRLKDPLDL